MAGRKLLALRTHSGTTAHRMAVCKYNARSRYDVRTRIRAINVAGHRFRLGWPHTLRSSGIVERRQVAVPVERLLCVSTVHMLMPAPTKST